MLRSMLTEDASALVRPSVLSLCVTSEWCDGLRVESGSYPRPSWPWETAPWHACPDSHVEALMRCSGAFSDGTQRDGGDGLFSGFGVAWAQDGVTSCTSGVVTCGSSAFRGEGAGAGAAIEDHAHRQPGTVLHLHSDCMGVLGRIWCMYTRVWDDKLLPSWPPTARLRFGVWCTNTCCVSRRLAAVWYSIGSQGTRLVRRICTWHKICVMHSATPFDERTGRPCSRGRRPSRGTSTLCCGTT